MEAVLLNDTKIIRSRHCLGRGQTQGQGKVECLTIHQIFLLLYSRENFISNCAFFKALGPANSSDPTASPDLRVVVTWRDRMAWCNLKVHIHTAPCFNRK